MNTELERARDRFIAADGALKFAREMERKAQHEHDQAAREYAAMQLGET